jgi:hypothetical protein
VKRRLNAAEVLNGKSPAEMQGFSFSDGTWEVASRPIADEAGTRTRFDA